MALLPNRFGGDGLYILDEPEAALSPQRQLAALSRLHDLVHTNAQFIIAIHSPIFMAHPDAWICARTTDGLQRVNCQDTEQYQVMKDFLDNPERRLSVLRER